MWRNQVPGFQPIPSQECKNNVKIGQEQITCDIDRHAQVDG
jgi:hypothetical protein